MSIQILIDMNLSPNWVDELSKHGWASMHWSAIGDPKATDHEIMDWARNNDRVVFTHDVDFGTMLALTHASGTSVIQVRGQNVLPDHMAPIVLAALKQQETDLAAGALAELWDMNPTAGVLSILGAVLLCFVWVVPSVQYRIVRRKTRAALEQAANQALNPTGNRPAS